MIGNKEDQRVIEKAISNLKVCGELSVNGVRLGGIAKDLRTLLPPEEKRIGGLTIPEWKMLVEIEDVLVEVRDENYNAWKPRYLKEIGENGGFICWTDGGTSKTGNWAIHSNQCRLIEDDRWRMNEGFQMVPDDVIVEVLQPTGPLLTDIASSFDWRIEVLAFRIIGVEGE